MSESSIKVIVLPSLVYPYFKLDIEQGEIHIALKIKRETKWMNDFAPFSNSLYFGVILTGGVY